MNIKVKNIPVRLLITVAILLLLIAFMIGMQCSLGRYTTSFGGEVKFSPNAKGTFELNYDEWSVLQDRDGQRLSLSITNGWDSSDVTAERVRIRLFVPYTDVTLPTLFLNQDGEEYTAIVSELPKGTAAYKAYGEGLICCFYGVDGEELVFDLPDSAEAWEATLIFADAEADMTGVELIVETVNTKRTGGNRL